MAFVFNRAAAAAAAGAPAPSASAVQPAAAHPLPPPGQPLVPVPQAAPSAAQPSPAGAAAPSTRRRGRPRASDVAAAPPAAAIPGQQSIIAPPAPPTVAAVLTPPLAAAPAPVAVAQALPMAQPAQTPHALATMPGGLMALFAPPPGQTSALAEVVAIGDQQGGEANLFPAVYLVGGEAGGFMDKDTMNVQNSDAELPVGRDPFACILFGFRYVQLLWPRGQGPKGSQVKVSPRHRGIIGSSRPDLVKLATAARKTYQMRDRPQVKGGPEPFYDEHGHPGLSVEMLVFDPDAGVYAVRSTDTYDGFMFVNREMSAVFPNQQIQPVPVVIAPHTFQSKGSKAMPNGWPEHGYKVSQHVDAQLWNDFAAFNAHTQNDQEFITAMTDWATTSISEVVVAELQKIAG